jgi:hypothetical protein
MNRRLIGRVALLAASSLVALGAVETYVRMAGLDRPLVWQPHPELGWWHLPNATVHWTEEGDGHVRINSRGLRDVERPVSKPPGVFRIAVFGDSMTEGVQVNLEETFTRQLEARLRRRGLQVDVLNFGVNGYSPLQEYLLYLHGGRDYQPDLVLQALFLDNDVADTHPDLAAGQGGAPIVQRTRDGLVINDGPARHSSRDYHSQPISAIRRSSALYRLISAVRWARKGSTAANDSAVGGVPRRYLLYAEPQSEAWEDAWLRLEFVLAAFNRDVKATGSRFAVISVPAGQVTDERAWLSLLEERPAMQGRDWKLLNPERRLAEVTSRLDIPLMTPLDEFRRRVAAEPLFFGKVGHFTSGGHALMAERLEQWLVDRGYVPSQTP